MNVSKDTKRRGPHMCMSCAHRFTAWTYLDRPHYRECPKCGRPSLPFGISGMAAMLEHLVRENEKLSMAVFDLECAEEARAEPGVSTA